MSDELKSKIIQLYELNISIYKIAEMAKCNLETVEKVICELIAKEIAEIV